MPQSLGHYAKNGYYKFQSAFTEKDAEDVVKAIHKVAKYIL